MIGNKSLNDHIRKSAKKVRVPLQLEVSEEELAKRKALWVAPEPLAKRGYVKIYIDHVEQAEKGADLDILVGGSGSKVERDLH